MPTAKKGETIDELAQKLGKARLAVLTDYRGLTVSQLDDLRRQLRPLNVEYQVAKNTLVRKAAEKAGIKDLQTQLEGPTAIAFCYEDIVAPTKVLGEFAKSTKIMTVKSGVLGTRLISPTDLTRLATLPPREMLVAKVLGSLQSPLVSLVSVLHGPMRGLLYVLQARARQLEEPAS